MSKKFDTKTFIKKSLEVHKDKYDYSKTEYINAHIKVCIICNEHGEFWQTPNAHLKGKGCPKCGNIKRSISQRTTLGDFIEKARNVHKDKYDYSKVEYINNSTKVCIICNEHGEFWQTPSNHLAKQGCSKCQNRATNTEEFIEKARNVHNNKYDYSEVVYIRSNKSVCIKCPIHGEFWQTPNNHLRGKGCPVCGHIRSNESKSKTFLYFKEKANIVHNNKYDYSNVVYRKYTDKVPIICPEHGEFWQKFSNHLMGNGCPECAESHMEKEIKMFLIKNNIEFEEQKKFDWLKNEKTKLPLILDFYLPDYNIAIECQGGQHFRPIELFGGKETFNNTLERDKIKKNLCESKGIEIMYYANKESKIPKTWDLYEVITEKQNLLDKIRRTS